MPYKYKISISLFGLYHTSYHMRIFGATFEKKYTKALEGLPLGRFEKNLIKDRYVSIVTKAEDDYRWTCVLYYLLSNIITISGVLITAFVSFDKIFGNCNSIVTAFFWVIWGLSIALTLSNKWLHSFNVHKKYILNKAVLEKFYSEGWSFMMGISRYKKCKDLDERFKLFCTRIEKIKLKSIESMPGMETSEAAAEILAAGTNSSGVVDDSPAKTLNTLNTHNTHATGKYKSARSKSSRSIKKKKSLRGLSQIPSPSHDNIADDDDKILHSAFESSNPGAMHQTVEDQLGDEKTE